MLAAEDDNELNEAFIRDIATFSALYFLGDYVAKGIASLMQKTSKTKLLNYTKNTASSKNLFKKFAYWVKDTKLKSFDEAALISPKTKGLRAICETGSLGFSMLLLGFLVPWYVRNQTTKNRRKELIANLSKYHPYPMLHIDAKLRKTFQAFGITETNNNR
jgi:hypothetical protein